MRRSKIVGPREERSPKAVLRRRPRASSVSEEIKTSRAVIPVGGYRLSSTSRRGAKISIRADKKLSAARCVPRRLVSNLLQLLIGSRTPSAIRKRRSANSQQRRVELRAMLSADVRFDGDRRGDRSVSLDHRCEATDARCSRPQCRWMKVP